MNFTECGSSSTTVWEKLDGTVKYERKQFPFNRIECKSIWHMFGEANA